MFAHDLFDRDHVHTLLAEVDGETAVISTGKGGVVLRHDPTTGEPCGGRRSASTATTS